MRFSLRLKKDEDAEVERLAKRIGINLNILGAKKKTLMDAVKIANKRLDEIEAKAQMFAEEERLYVLKVWGVKGR